MTTSAHDVGPGVELGGHPYDYYWRPGMSLRPAPPRLRRDPIWDHTRRMLREPWHGEFSEEPKTTQWTELWVDHLWQGDELMDAVVDRFREIGMAQGRALLEQALEHGIDTVDDPPPELVVLFGDLDNPPEWYDPEQWERGRQLWIDASLAGKVGMIAGDFFGTFVGDEVAYATGETGRFVNDFYRRNLETMAWFRMTSVRGAMDRFADPFKDTVRVRLMHSQVRAGLRQTWGEEQFAHHGNPISNAMMMTAAATFALQPLLVDHAHGRVHSVSEMDAVSMYWAYIARVFGVADELIPRDAEQALEGMDFIVAYAGGPSEWTETMIGAAADNFGGGSRLARAVVSPALGLLAYYGGEGMTRALVRGTSWEGVSLRPWMKAASVFVHGNVAFRRVLDRTPGAAERAARRDSDTMLYGNGLKVARFMASRKGIHGTPYDHHDQTVSVATGCPIPHAPESAGRQD